MQADHRPWRTRHAVVLAAGESRRTRPLTLHTPKPLIPLIEHPLLGYILDEMVGLVDQVTLVVGYRADDIRQSLGTQYRGMALQYVHQQGMKGTAGALLAVADAGGLDEPFLLLYGDNLISRVDLVQVCQQRYAMAALPVDAPSAFGILEVIDQHVVRIIEKPAQAPPGSLANPGIFHFDSDVFPLLRQIQPSPRGEYELTDLIALVASRHPFAYHICQGNWVPVGTPWEALIATMFLLARDITSDTAEVRAQTVGQDLTIHGPVQIGRAQIGPNCTIQGPCFIGDDVVIGAGCRINQGVLERGVTLGMNCTLQHSVLRAGVSVGGNSVIEYSFLDQQASTGTAAHMHARVFDDIIPIAHAPGLLQREQQRQRGVVLGSGVVVPAGATLAAGTVVFPPES
ncbi:MAG: NTP transferase domain-containing protein [Chloroflexaceae bacterium]|nr:NTP transferase domain-containing protein [Chloroflexaceae bacterium]